MRKPVEGLFGPGEVAVGIISLIGLYVISLNSYTTFHTLVELFSIIIGFSLFMLIWNSRRIIDNNYLVFIGIAYLFVAGFDLIHTLSYKKIELFTGYGTNLTTQLWIGARYMESLSLLVAPFFIRRKLIAGWALAGYIALTLILLTSMFGGIFPACYVDGTGLTRFKISSEYLISIILFCSLIYLLRKRQEFDRNVLDILVLSIIITIASEISFTFYVDFYDITNLIGHYLKIISFYLIYKAIIVTGFSKPYNVMFRNLKQQEEALRESEERYHSLFENMSEGFALHEIICDERGVPADYRFLDVNPAFEALTGLQRERIVGRLLTETLPGEDPKWIRLYGEVAMTGKPLHIENYSPALKRHYEVFAYRPAPQRFAVIFMDVTDRKQIEATLAAQAASLQEQTIQLEAANRELESFSYSVSHDLRTPLRAIDGFSRKLLRDVENKLNEDDKRKFDVIRNNVRMMGQVIDDLLAFSRLGRQAISLSFVDMNNLFNQVWEESRAMSTERKIELKMVDLPQAVGDYGLLKQVISNLISNSVKFTKFREEAVIEIAGSEEGSENVYYVKDNGVGFNMEYYGKLFGVFQRLHNAFDYEGTGIGLSIVARIIQRHGGRVWAEGKEDEGAVFYFTLPAKSQEAAEPAKN